MKKFSCVAALYLASLLAVAQTTASLSSADLIKKAEAGDAEAQFQLGRAYEDGESVEQSDELAVHWYRKSAEQGNARAENSLGVMYSRGHGVPRDKEEAFRWYRKAAKQGLPEADFNIAISYYNGDGAGSDLNRAYAWILIAKRHGSSNAGQALAQISQDLHGHLEFGTMLLGQLYEKGEETPKDLNAAFDTYLQGANSDPKRAGAAQFKLCQFYGTGTGVPQDVVEARSWCKTAARNGIPAAMVVLGHMAENGVGTEKNLKEAEQWYQDAAVQMDRDGFMALGRLKFNSSSHNDQRDAYFWFYLASVYKMPGAQEQLQKAAANLSSEEISKEQKKAAEWRKTIHVKR